MRSPHNPRAQEQQQFLFPPVFEASLKKGRSALPERKSAGSKRVSVSWPRGLEAACSEKAPQAQTHLVWLIFVCSIFLRTSEKRKKCWLVCVPGGGMGGLGGDDVTCGCISASSTIPSGHHFTTCDLGATFLPWGSAVVTLLYSYTSTR